MLYFYAMLLHINIGSELLAILVLYTRNIILISYIKYNPFILFPNQPVLCCRRKYVVPQTLSQEVTFQHVLCFACPNE